MTTSSNHNVRMNLTANTAQAEAAMKRLETSMRRVTSFSRVSAQQKSYEKMGLFFKESGRIYTDVGGKMTRIDEKRAAEIKNNYEAQQRVIRDQQSAIRASENVKQDAFNRTKNSVKNLQNAFLGMGLSMLFTGMAIKQTIEGFIRRAVDSYMQMADKNSELLKDVLAMQAAFKYLQYVIVDALQSAGIFDIITQTFERIGRWINQLTPQQKEFWGKFLMWTVVVSGAMMILGQTLLALLAPIALLVLSGYSLSVAFAWMGGLIAAIIIVTSLFLIFNSDMSRLDKTLAVLGGTLLLIAGRLLYVGIVGKSVGALISAGFAFGIASIIGVYFLLKSKYGADWWKQWLGGIGLIVVSWFEFLDQYAFAPLRKSIELLLKGFIAISKAADKFINKGRPSGLTEALDRALVDIRSTGFVDSLAIEKWMASKGWADVGQYDNATSEINAATGTVNNAAINASNATISASDANTAAIINSSQQNASTIVTAITSMMTPINEALSIGNEDGDTKYLEMMQMQTDATKELDKNMPEGVSSGVVSGMKKVIPDLVNGIKDGFKSAGISVSPSAL